MDRVGWRLPIGSDYSPNPLRRYPKTRSEVVDDAEALGARRAWYTEQFSKSSAEAIRVAKDVFYHGMDLEFPKAARIAVNGMHLLNAQGEVDKGLNEFERQRSEK